MEKITEKCPMCGAPTNMTLSGLDMVSNSGDESLASKNYEYTDYIEKLTDLQLQVGYKPGKINPIALLGLFGEAGEVLHETTLLSKDPMPEMIKQTAVSIASLMDNLKKRIRDNKANQDFIAVFIDEDSEEKFDKEVADALYYLNAIAIARGKSLYEYAGISFRKVSAKLQINISPDGKQD